MSRDFILRRIAQDAFDPVALADEVDESRMSSVKHEVARNLFRASLSARLGRWQTAGAFGLPFWDDLSRGATV